MTVQTPVVATPDTLLALHAAHPRRYPVLLQSAAHGEPLGRYDILLAHPRERLWLDADGLHATGELKIGDSFLATLDGWWTRARTAPSQTEFPFVGGWFLYFAYEFAAQVEPSLRLVTSAPLAAALRMPAAIIVRHSDGKAFVVDEEGDCVASILADLATVRDTTEYRGAILQSALREDAPRGYLDAVRAALEHIAAGDIYQANLSRAWTGRLNDGVQPHDVYRRLRHANPAPFAALAVWDDLAIVSSSPERLVDVRNGIASTRPIAGTRPRTSDRHDDAQRRQELRAHPKERAEHVMLIDLERNDLGRVCLPGTVTVDEFMTLESYAHVHHIVSNVRGRLRADVTPGQVIAAVFPGGTITGVPKVRCMQIIAELERAPRGAYTGALGYLNRDGSMDLNILIRTIALRGRMLEFRAGAGIVADSIPERELEETRAKARGLVNALT